MRLLLFLLLFLVGAALAGCNAIALQGKALERGFRRAGLTRAVELVGDATVHHYASAPGPARTVLLLHGFGAEAVWQWGPQVRALRRAGYRVLVPNLLWFGRSTSPRRDFSIQHQAATVLALLDHVGAERVDVVGISYGGLLAWFLAGAHPERVGRVVLIDSPGAVFTRQDYEGMLARFGVAHPGPLLVPSEPKGVQRLVDLAYFRPPLVLRPLRQQILRELYATDREEKVALLLDMTERMDALRAEAPAVSAPTLLVWGEHDEVFPLDVAHRLLATLPNGRLVVVRGARHAPQLEHPAAVNRAILEFLEE